MNTGFVGSQPLAITGATTCDEHKTGVGKRQVRNRASANQVRDMRGFLKATAIKQSLLAAWFELKKEN